MGPVVQTSLKGIRWRSLVTPDCPSHLNYSHEYFQPVFRRGSLYYQINRVESGLSCDLPYIIITAWFYFPSSIAKLDLRRKLLKLILRSSSSLSLLFQQHFRKARDPAHRIQMAFYLLVYSQPKFKMCGIQHFPFFCSLKAFLFLLSTPEED